METSKQSTDGTQPTDVKDKENDKADSPKDKRTKPWVNPRLQNIVSPIVAEIPFNDNEKGMEKHETYLVQGGLTFQANDKLHNFNVTVDTACGPNLIRTDMIAPEYTEFVRPITDPHLIAANSGALSFRGTIPIDVTLGDSTTRIWFGVVDDLPPGIILGTAFIDKMVKAILPQKRRIHLLFSRPIPIIDSTPTENGVSSIASISTPTALQRNDSFPTEDEEEVLIRATHRTVIAPRSFKLIKVSCPHNGLITVRPHWRTTKNLVMAANGIADVRKNAEFKIWVGNFSNIPVTIVKNMRVALADPPPLFTIDETDLRQHNEQRGRVPNKEGGEQTADVIDNMVGINPITRIQNDTKIRQQRIIEANQKEKNKPQVLENDIDRTNHGRTVTFNDVTQVTFLPDYMENRWHSKRRKLIRDELKTDRLTAVTPKRFKVQSER